MSEVEPGDKVTTTRIGLLGQAWAQAWSEAPKVAHRTAAAVRPKAPMRRAGAISERIKGLSRRVKVEIPAQCEEAPGACQGDARKDRFRIVA
jgi:hypothetical protein